MTKRIYISLLLVLSLSVAAFAHGGVEHLKGQVAAVTDTSVTITTTDKESKTVTFDKDTKFMKSGVASTAKELKVGDKVVIDYHEMKGGLHAAQVRFGAPSKEGKAAEGHSGHKQHEEKK